MGGAGAREEAKEHPADGNFHGDEATPWGTEKDKNSSVRPDSSGIQQ